MSIADENGSLYTTPVAPDELRGIAFKAGSSIGLAVGEKGKILRSSNSGNSWSDVTDVEPQILYATQQLNSRTGYGVGKESTIVKTSDGGASWEAIPNAHVQDLHGLFFSNESTGVVAGNAGMLLRSTNGSSFSPVSIPTTANLKDVHAADGLWLAVGTAGTILKSSNEGLSWSLQTSGSLMDLQAVYVIDKSTAYAVGTGGTILRGTNNAENWEVLRQTDGANWTTSTLNDVYFKDYVTGYAVGQEGTLLKTVTRGETWEAETGQGNSSLTAIQPRQEGTVVITGANGSVLRYQDESDQFGTRFYYDKLCRLAISQNARQYNKSTPAYSYTVYDAIGRISQVGEIIQGTEPGSLKDANGQLNQELLNSWIAAGAKSQITRTYYDIAPFEVPGLEQSNLRTRVASTTYQQEDGQGYDHASHYSYDIHGNVKTLVQENTALTDIAVEEQPSQQYKRIDYVYDLVSGNVNEVQYQKEQPDQFFHRYSYDADNRIREVYTSSDYVVWDKDAGYQYYQHGPLARMELGAQKVQGIDYAYTIQGWIKGVNSTSLDSNKDLGKDGAAGSSFAKDEFGYSLSYFDGDYSAVNSPATDLDLSHGNNLYNGNIRNMTTSIRAFMGGGTSGQEGVSQNMAYQYDQLNRISEASAFDLQTADGSLTAKPDYSASYSYDANGNLMNLSRNATTKSATEEEGKLEMDELEYVYENKANGYERNTNKLRQVKDAVAPGDYEDVDNQQRDNYAYDEIGNLIKDDQEKIINIEWTVYGKVAKVEKEGEVSISFAYDAAGNRISKRDRSPSNDRTTYYVRDASGNVMAIYKKDAQGYHLTEQPIYGSDRIGQRQESITLVGSPVNEQKTHRVGIKAYELKNHLGNVLATVADRKDGSGNAVVLSASDYYPFGMLMPGRSERSNDSRYGFNGKERDTEWGSSVYDYGFRIYNPQIGKFLSVDPLFQTYPAYTSYQFASNTPIAAIDRDGLEAEIVINSPYFYDRMKKAFDAGDIDEAQRLAWISINADRPPDVNGSTYNERAYKGAKTAGTFNWNERNPNVLTVFDSDGNEMFMVIREESPKIMEKTEDSGYMDKALGYLKNLVDWDVEGPGSTQEGGFHFYAKGAAGFTKAKSKSRVQSIDLTEILIVLGATKFGPSGPPSFEIESFVGTIAGIVQTSKEIRDDNKKDTNTKPDSTYCNYCDKNVHTSEVKGHFTDYKEESEKP